MTKTNNNRYPQGYLPKIAYHLGQGNIQKFHYFMKRQIEAYGDLSEQDHQTIRRLAAL
jgi:hypothetical protein